MKTTEGPLPEEMRRLTAPDHGDEFFSEMWQQVDREAASRNRGRQKRTAARSILPGRVRLALVSLAAAAVAVVVAALLLDGLPGAGTFQTETATAASVEARLGRAMTTWRTFEAVMVLRLNTHSDYPSDPVTACIQVTLSSDGGEKWEWQTVRGPKGVGLLPAHAGDIEAYNPETNESQVYREDGDDSAPTVTIASDAVYASLGPLQPYAAVARAVLAELPPDTPVESTLQAGRPAWELELTQTTPVTMPVLPADGRPEPGMRVPRGFDFAERVLVTVDKATGMPLRMVGTDRLGRVVGDMHLQEVHVDRELQPGTFRLTPPAGAEVRRMQSRAQVVTLPEVEALSGQPPLVPLNVPAGYSLANVCVISDFRGAVAVELFYRRGFDVFVIGVAGTDFAQWSDGLFFFSLKDAVTPAEAPSADLTGGTDPSARLQTHTLQRGAFAGHEASTTLSARWAPQVWRGPSLWATGDGRQLFITGALTRAEMVTVAESLEQWDE